ncbi:phosphoserine phosphatase SerB [Moraxella cuniculi]|uniref:Phosphoserine phosphatase n=1 Tax=Moraxella cuniculi TaxID=34061 RepID=A0A3S4R515_9GAMM|nr:phosphoserine phosphatase SerB [Moraxella cuniculi]VEG12977.1 Phosphoserine phosphatase [Moraxella cuniculi]
MSYTYQLPKNSKAWQHTLNSLSDKLPSVPTGADFGTDDAYATLAALPIFAIIIVSPATESNIDTLIQNWVQSQPNWQLHSLIDDTTTASTHKISSDEALADVAIHRYLLAPKTNFAINKDAAAHILDEQISSHLSAHIHADVHILSIEKMLNEHRLACFDMDSTLIEQEVIVELAKFCGVAEKVAEITEQAMRGEIDFATSFARRVALLAETPIEIVDEIIAKQISFSRGAAATIHALKALGYHTVLISGGFEPFAKYVANTLGIDEYYANPLISDGKTLTGTIGDTILDGTQKAIITQQVAERLGLSPQQIVCIGDGANDLPMMNISDIGIAYHAKPIVQAKADAAINTTGLEGVLYVLGHRLDKCSR